MLSPVSTIFLLVAATTLAAAADLELPESAKAVADEFTERCLTEANVDREKFASSLYYDAKPNYGLRYFYVCLLKSYGLLNEDGQIDLPVDFPDLKKNQACINSIEEKDIGNKAFLARICVWENAVAAKNGFTPRPAHMLRSELPTEATPLASEMPETLPTEAPLASEIPETAKNAGLPESVKAITNAVIALCLEQEKIDVVKYGASLYHEAKPIRELIPLYICLLRNFGVLNAAGEIILPDDFANRAANQKCINEIPSHLPLGERVFQSKICVWNSENPSA